MSRGRGMRGCGPGCASTAAMGSATTCLRRRVIVQQQMHEAGVGAVLQQAPHQIGQEVLVRAHRRIGAKRKRPEHLARRRIKRLAHAMQALMLDWRAPRHGAHGRQGVGIVGGELGVEIRMRLDQGAGADQIRQIGGGLGGEDRIARTPACLGTLDLAVPIGALDQPHHQPPAAVLRQRRQQRDHLGRPLLVGLHRQTKPAPGAQRRLARQPVQQLQRQHQPVGFLGVDREIDVGLCRHVRQPLQARI